MFCTKCGSKNDDSAAFCGNCGAKMKNPQPEIQTIASASEAGKAVVINGDKATTNPRGKKKLIVIVVIIIAILVAGFAALYLFGFVFSDPIYVPSKITQYDKEGEIIVETSKTYESGFLAKEFISRKWPSNSDTEIVYERNEEGLLIKDDTYPYADFDLSQDGLPLNCYVLGKASDQNVILSYEYDGSLLVSSSRTIKNGDEIIIDSKKEYKDGLIVSSYIVPLPFLNDLINEGFLRYSTLSNYDYYMSENNLPISAHRVITTTHQQDISAKPKEDTTEADLIYEYNEDGCLIRVNSSDGSYKVIDDYQKIENPTPLQRFYATIDNASLWTM